MRRSPNWSAAPAASSTPPSSPHSPTTLVSTSHRPLPSPPKPRNPSPETAKEPDTHDAHPQDRDPARAACSRCRTLRQLEVDRHPPRQGGHTSHLGRSGRMVLGLTRTLRIPTFAVAGGCELMADRPLGVAPGGRARLASPRLRPDRRPRVLI